jgi:hypothetical protein
MKTELSNFVFLFRFFLLFSSDKNWQRQIEVHSGIDRKKFALGSANPDFV